MKTPPLERFDGLGNTREQRVLTLEAKIHEASKQGQTEKVVNLERIYTYERICLELNQ